MKNPFRSFRAVIMTAVILLGFLAGYPLPLTGAVYSPEEIDRYTLAAREAGANGMVIAYGGGFDTEALFRPLLQRSIAHTGKDAPRMLLLPTGAMDELGDHQEKLDWFGNAGCETDVLYVSRASEAEIREKIEWADIIYATGGNLRYLTEQWSAKGVYDAMKAAFARGAVLMGVSTGAMCWAERGWDDFEEPTMRVIGSFPFWGEAGGFAYRDAAGLLPFCICPHFDNTGWRMFAFEAAELDIPSLCIENGAAVIFCGGEYEVTADARTPWRTAYLFYPAKHIVMRNLRPDASILTVTDGERRLAR